MKFKELLYLTIKHIYFFRFQLLKALMLPFMLTILLDIFASVWSGILISLIYYFLSLMFQTIIAITTHRIILLGPSHVPEWGITKWSRRETVFACYILALALIGFLSGFLLQVPSVGSILMVLVMVYIVFLIPRLSLVFPAIAIGDSCSFKSSWFFTKNYYKLMFFSTILIPLVVSIPVLLISYIPYTFIIVCVLSNITIIVGISSLSLSYKFILKEISKDS